MTLLVVLGVVVIATILAALYLSLKSGRGDEPAPDAAGAGDRQARGGRRSGRSPSLANRVRSMADRGRSAGSSRRRFGGDDDDEYDVPDHVAARRSSRGAGSGDRSGLVTAGTGQRAAGGRGAAGFDDTDPALQAGYGHGGAGYDGFDAAADTRVSGPSGTEPDTGPYDTAGYDTSAYEAGTGPSRRYRSEPSGYGSEPSGGYRGRAGAGDRGPDADSPRRRYPGSARQGTGGSQTYPPPDRYSPAGHRTPVDGRAAVDGRAPAAGRSGNPGERGPRPGGYDADPAGPAGPEGDDFGVPAARTPRAHGRPSGRRRAVAPDPAPSADYDDAPTALTDSPFSSASEADYPPEDAHESSDSSRTGRRRIAKIQKPQLRIGRSRQDYDNDPWPSADEVDGVSDDQFWSDISSDKPLATTARAAQAPGDPGQPSAPGDGPGGPGPAASPGSADMVPAPVPADAPPMGPGRRARKRAEEPEDSTEPRPLQQPGSGPGGPGGPGGPRRRGEPTRPPRAEEDPLTSASFSRHAREASDSRSYRGSRQAHRPAHGRPDESAAETQTMRPDPYGYGAPGPAGAPGPGSPRRGVPGPGARPGPGGAYVPGQRQTGGLPPAGPSGRGGYRYGARPAGPHPGGDGGNGGYEPPARASRHASPAGGGRPPAAGGPQRPRPALPGPASGSPTYPGPSYPGGNGSSSYPGPNGSSANPGPSGNPSSPGANGNSSSPRTYGDAPSPGGSAGSGGYPRGRRSSNRDSRRPDDPYRDPYGRPDDTRY